jgi:hypothetical protein
MNRVRRGFLTPLPTLFKYKLSAAERMNSMALGFVAGRKTSRDPQISLFSFFIGVSSIPHAHTISLTPTKKAHPSWCSPSRSTRGGVFLYLAHEAKNASMSSRRMRMLRPLPMRRCGNIPARHQPQIVPGLAPISSAASSTVKICLPDASPVRTFPLPVLSFVFIYLVARSQLVRYGHAMNLISTAEFARLAGIRPETAWRVADSGALPSAQRVGKLWKISRADCLKWIESRPPKSAITPESTAKQIGCSGAHVRALLEKGKFSFAKRRPNRRWILADSEEYRWWISDQKRYAARRKKAAMVSGRNSGIPSYQGILQAWQRWEKKVGGALGITNWPPDVQEQWLDDMRPVAELINRVISRQKQGTD